MLVKEALKHEHDKTPVYWLGRTYLIKGHLHGHPGDYIDDFLFEIVPYYRRNLYKPIVIEARCLEEAD